MSLKILTRIALLSVLAVIAAACGGTDDPAATTTGAPDDGSSSTSTTSGEGDPTETTAPGEESTTTTSAPEAPLVGLEKKLLASGLRQPTILTSRPGDDRLFIGERGGIIRIYDLEDGLLDEPFMSIPDRVTSNGIEQGLLGLAFHPDFENNGRFFIYHTDRDAKRQLAEYRVLPNDPDKADLDSGVVLFDREQPPGSTDIRHYAGMVMFGPDGYLYISSGDGAAGKVTGQSIDDYFGAILRIDVDSGDPFAIPAGNPYADVDGAEPVWATGLRNPWRFTIDGDMMYIADVGQADIEEVNVVSLSDAGVNFGWSTMEGSDCFSPSDCDKTGLELPIYEYTHSDGCSITGGHVYRGESMPELHGHYFFSDWCDSWIRTLVYTDGELETVRDWSADLGDPGSVNVFGVDSRGELYFATHEGDLYAIVGVR